MACIIQECRIDDGDDDNNNRELTSILIGNPSLFNHKYFATGLISLLLLIILKIHSPHQIYW